MKWILLVCLGLALGSVSTAAGQVSGHLDLGLGGASVPGLGMTSLWAAAPRLTLQTRSFRLDGSGEFRDLGAGRRDIAGVVAGAWFVPLAGPILLDLNAGGAIREGTGLSSASLWNGGARLHLRSAVTGVWLGVSSGRDRFGGLQGWEAGLWRDLGPVSVQLQGRQTSGAVVVNEPLILADTIVRVDSTAQNRVRLTTELGGWLGYRTGRLQLRGGAGWRLSHREPARSGALADVLASPGRTSDGWWTAEATYWLSDRLGLTGAMGRLAPNPSLLVSAANFLKVSVRVGLNRHLADPVGPPPERSGLTVRRNAGVVELSLEAPVAGTVEVMSDLTDWQPLPMTREGTGRWRIRLPALAGLHYLNVRYDGGVWRTPPTLRAVADEFGKETGVLLVD